MNTRTKNTVRCAGAAMAVFAGLMLLVGIAVMPAGCAVFDAFKQATPQQRLDGYTVAYTAAMGAAVDLRRAGTLDDDAYRAVESVRAPVALALDQAQARIDQGDEQSATTSLDRAAAFLDQLAEILAAAREKPPGG